VPVFTINYGFLISSKLVKTGEEPIDFYLSEEAQAVYAESAHGIVVEKREEKLAPEVEAILK